MTVSPVLFHENVDKLHVHAVGSKGFMSYQFLDQDILIIISTITVKQMNVDVAAQSISSLRRPRNSTRTICL